MKLYYDSPELKEEERNQKTKYDPYGKVTIYTGKGVDGIWFTSDDVSSSTSGVKNPYTYTGRRLDTETGLMYFRNRYYSVDLGRFISRDAKEYVDGWNLYRGYFAVNGMDALGLWGAGNEGDANADPATRGHSDFPGSENLQGGIFDYNEEDEDAKTRPENPKATWRHFRSLDDSETDLAKDVCDCNKEQFERHAHQMQDFFSHYGQGTRAWGGPGIWGHAGTTAVAAVGRVVGVGTARPDNAVDYRDAYDAAYQRTQMWVDKWKKCCEKGCDDKWKKKKGRPEEECCKKPKNPYGETAPPPTPEPGWVSSAISTIGGWF